MNCAARTDTGYDGGRAYMITVIQVDGEPVERETANHYVAMQQAAARAGVTLRITSGFRTMAEQEYFYGCYVNCNCNDCNLAARPGYSPHQNGRALDLNHRDSGCEWRRPRGPGDLEPERRGPLGELDGGGAIDGQRLHVGGVVVRDAAAHAQRRSDARLPAPGRGLDGAERDDLAVLSPNAGGGWADWISMNLSTGSGFSSGVWRAATPQHLRNGKR